MYSHDKPERPQSLPGAVRAQARQKLLRMDEKEMLAALKQQGIGNLEELASALVANTQALGRAGVAIDWEDFPICYPFMVYRPHFDKEILEEFEQYASRLAGGGPAAGGQIAGGGQITGGGPG